MNATYTEDQLQKLPFRNSKLELEKRVDDLLSQLTQCRKDDVAHETN